MIKRLGVSKKEQRKFFRNIKAVSGLGWSELSVFCDVSQRAFGDWTRARYTAPFEAASLLSSKFKVALPKNRKILEPYWYIKKYAVRGALARQKLYGLLGNIETRRRGGLISQQRRRKNPDKYRLLGCNVRKESKPLKESKELAELFGILLGDGGITDNQIRVTLNRKTDREYANFVSRLIYKIFKEKPSINKRKNVLNLTLSGVNIVESLEKLGLKRGNKVANQVPISRWILNNRNFAKACVRGLIDTDGGVYFHNHVTNGIRYTHFGLTFSNHSRPIIQGVNKILRESSFTPSIVKNRKIYIYTLSEIKRYFQIIGSSNPKHTQRFNHYLISKHK